MVKKQKKGIDFIIVWVDGNDQAWRKEKERYAPEWQSDIREQRYRDWGNLQYWFRGVEQYTPWVHKIHFVTYGHLPKWLNTDHPKLNIVKHSDFIPSKYLPTFNCNCIENNLHRINGLAEQFVYFNDDTFVISEMAETDFFKNGKPCDAAALNVHCLDANFGFNYASFQAIGIVNKYFDFHHSIFKNWNKWINVKNRRYLLRTLYLLPCPRFPGIFQPHLPNSYLKSTFKELWEKEEKLFDETCMNRFRGKLDYTQWVMRNWQIAGGRFEPRDINIGKSFILEKNRDNINTVYKYIVERKGKMIAVNDGEMARREFVYNKKKLVEAFDKILPYKSGYEI